MIHRTIKIKKRSEYTAFFITDLNVVIRYSTVKSTRRFCFRPSDVLLSPRGCDDP